MIKMVDDFFRLLLWYENSTHWLCLVIYCQKIHQLKLTKFRTVVTQGNIGSEKTLEKSGFRLTGVISNNF